MFLKNSAGKKQKIPHKNRVRNILHLYFMANKTMDKQLQREKTKADKTYMT